MILILWLAGGYCLLIWMVWNLEQPSVSAWTAKRCYLAAMFVLVGLMALTVAKALIWHQELVQLLTVCR